ncbi:MAG TPA: hypothetical protein VF541_11815 [Longimicrobium sp.]|jgi:hypothetical protein
MTYPEQQASQDAEHLRLLAIFHTIAAVLTALFASIFIAHVVFGIAALRDPASFGGTDGPPDAAFGWIFVAMGSLAVLAGWALAVLIFLAGRYLRQRRHYTFCLVVAGLSCMIMPFGTALGIFSLIVLLRPTVKPLFAQPEAIPRPVRERPA